MKALQVPQAVRDALAERSGGMCEVCTRNPAQDAHHRMGRGAGGTRLEWMNDLSNLLHVCRYPCHHQLTDTGGNRTQYEAKGWIVSRRSGLLPADVPVFYRDYPRPMFLREDGGIDEATDAELIALFGFGYTVGGDAA